MQRFVRMVGGVLVSAILVVSGAVFAAESAADAGKTGQSGASMPSEQHKMHHHDAKKSRQHAKKKKADAGKTMNAAPATPSR